jgi:hypothetical protein
MRRVSLRGLIECDSAPTNDQRVSRTLGISFTVKKPTTSLPRDGPGSREVGPALVLLFIRPMNSAGHLTFEVLILKSSTELVGVNIWACYDTLH